MGELDQKAGKATCEWGASRDTEVGAGKSACVGVVLRGDGGHRESTGCSEQTALSPVPLAASLSPQPPRPSDPPILGRSCHRKSVSSTPRHHLRRVRITTAPPRHQRARPATADSLVYAPVGECHFARPFGPWNQPAQGAYNPDGRGGQPHLMAVRASRRGRAQAGPTHRQPGPPAAR